MPTTAWGRLRRPLLLALVVLPVVAGTVLAQDIPRLDERVTDAAGVLSDADVATAEEAIERLDDDANVQLWTLFVSTTEDLSITDYADAAAAEGGLGGNDALLVVAVDDRRDAMWVGDLLDDASDEEIDRILADRVEPQLADGAWGEAIAGAAEGLAAALEPDDGAVAPPPVDPDPEPDPGTADEGGSAFVIILGVALVGGGAFALWSWWQRRRAAGLDAEERDRRVGALARRANALLIETDELIRHDAQELGFAEAQFGPEAAATFRAALDQARSELKAAFGVRQRLDDADPETPEDRERMLGEVVTRCERAQDTLEEQTRRFQELRDLERRAPEILDAQPDAIAAISGRLAAAERTLGELREEASGSSKAVHGNLIEARKRLSLAEKATSEGHTALSGEDRGAAGRAARAAQDAVAQAVALVDAIDREHAALEAARQEVEPALGRARQDLRTAEAAAEGADERHAAALAEARARLEAAEAAARGDPRDLVLAYRLAGEAEAAADAVVADVRAGEERRAKALAGADAALRSAGLAVDRAADFIGTRRHVIGRRARTRLSEAQGSLERARDLREADPAAATEESRRAAGLADEAYRLAAGDLGGAQGTGRGGTVVINGRHYRAGRQADWGADIGGAIIGGIIGSILSGGGGGWGGGRRGGGFGGFGGGGRGFGGGGRSFGGGFGGGGGGRSRGGGW